jgi:hypothetical protein
MPILPKYIVLCDEIRQEVNGKFILLGVYMPDMTLSQLPFVIPALTFFVVLESDRPGNYQARFSLESLESGQKLFEGMGAVGFAKPGTGVLPIGVRNVMIQMAGTYVFTLNLEGQKDPITHSFNIFLVPQQQPGFPPGGFIPGQLPR